MSKRSAPVQPPQWLEPLLASLVGQLKLPPEDAEDLKADIRERVVSLVSDFAHERRPQPRQEERYLKEVARNAARDWLRGLRQKRPSQLSQSDRSLLDNELYSSVREEGDKPEGGFHAVRGPSARRPRRTQRPFLVRLIRRHERSLWDFESSVGAHVISRALYDLHHGQSAAIDEADERLRQLPNRTRQAATLYLRYWREADIARQLGISRAAVSKLLERMRQTWSWDDRSVEFERLRLLWANLLVVVREALKPFQSAEDKPERDDLPPEDDDLFEATWRRLQARPSRLDEMRGLLAGPGSQQDGLSSAWRRAREEAVFRALKASPALARSVRGIMMDDMPAIVFFVEDYDYVRY